MDAAVRRFGSRAGMTRWQGREWSQVPAKLIFVTDTAFPEAYTAAILSGADIMKKNVGTIDRSIRGLAGIALLAAYFLGAIQGTLGIVGLVFGIVLIGTAATGWCPPYMLIGLNTCGKQDSNPSA